MRDRFYDKLIEDSGERIVWKDLEALRGSDTVRHSRRFAAELQARRGRSVRWLTGWHIAMPATALAASAAAVLLLGQPAPAGQILQTQLGEMRRATLSDGTVVLLNTNSRLRVAFRKHAREITLIKGQARFDVAHDTSRPFRVTAGAMSVTAVGTAFDVEALPSRTAVTLIRGKVLVRTTDRTGVPSAPKTLFPGQQITIAAGQVTPPHAARLDAALAWQRSYVDLGNKTLSEAIEEVNRYSATKIVVDAPGLNNEKIGGVFKVGDTDAVSQTLCAYFGLTVVRRQPNQIVLGRADPNH